jgi:hypothetical protein
VEKNFYLLKVSKLSIKKKGSTMNLKDVLIAEEQENNKITEVSETSKMLICDSVGYSYGVFVFCNQFQSEYIAL